MCNPNYLLNLEAGVGFQCWVEEDLSWAILKAVLLTDTLEEGSANSSYKEPDSRYFKLYGPSGLFYHCNVSEWVWLCPNED